MFQRCPSRLKCCRCHTAMEISVMFTRLCFLTLYQYKYVKFDCVMICYFLSDFLFSFTTSKVNYSTVFIISHRYLDLCLQKANTKIYLYKHFIFPSDSTAFSIYKVFMYFCRPEQICLK